MDKIPYWYPGDVAIAAEALTREAQDRLVLAHNLLRLEAERQWLLGRVHGLNGGKAFKLPTYVKGQMPSAPQVDLPGALEEILRHADGLAGARTDTPISQVVASGQRIAAAVRKLRQEMREADELFSAGTAAHEPWPEAGVDHPLEAFDTTKYEYRIMPAHEYVAEYKAMLKRGWEHLDSRGRHLSTEVLLRRFKKASDRRRDDEGVR